MSQYHVERALRYLKRSTESIVEQITIALSMWYEGVDQSHDGLKANEIEEELSLDLDYQVRTSLDHLVEVGIVEEFTPPGPDTLAIASWKDDGDGEVVNGSVGETAEEGLDALAEEVESDSKPDGETATATDGSGITLRTALSDEFDLIPEKVENYLRTTEEPVKVLNRAVEAVEESEGLEVGEDYGEMVFINMPHRYRLTEAAADLYER